MKSFMTLLVEKLSDEDAAHVKTWYRDPTAIKHTDHFFGKKNDDVYEDLESDHNHKSEVHKEVERHIGQEIAHDDYRKGLTKDKHGRDSKIGRMIKDEGLRNRFANDDTRQNKNVNNFKVRTTRSPEGVAGQTSAGQSWEEHSCKNFKTGMFKDKLPHEVQHGTVVSYLHHPNGTELARATFHPFINKKGKRIYKQDSYYGMDHAAFKKHNKEMERRLSASHEAPTSPSDMEYKIHPNVYNDNKVEYTTHPNMSKEAIDKVLENNKAVHAHHLLTQRDDLHDDHIKKLLNHPNDEVRHEMLSSPHLKGGDLDHAVNNSDGKDKLHLALNPNLTSKHIHHLIDSDSDIYPSTSHELVKHPNLNHEHIDKLLKNKPEEVAGPALHHKNVSDKNLHDGLDRNSSLVREYAASSPHLKHEHFQKIINGDETWIKKSIASNAKLNSTQIHKLIDHNNLHINAGLTKNPNLQPEHIDKLLHPQNTDKVRDAAIQHKNVSEANIHKALDDTDADTRRWAINHTNATGHNINKALNDPDKSIRQAATRHKNATSENLHKALDDNKEDKVMPAIVGNHPNANDSHFEKILHPNFWDKRNPHSRDYAMIDTVHNPNMSKELLHKTAASHYSVHVRNEANAIHKKRFGHNAVNEDVKMFIKKILKDALGI